MKIKASIRSAKNRSRTCIVVKRGGRLFVIDKMNRRNNCRQGIGRR